MSGTVELEELFSTTMPDDSCGAAWPRGLEVVWSTTRTAQPGSVVLVRDKHNQLHARHYRQGRAPGHWIAAAENPAFATFDSITDRLTVVAVAAFRAV